MGLKESDDDSQMESEEEIDEMESENDDSEGSVENEEDSDEQTSIEDDEESDEETAMQDGNENSEQQYLSKSLSVQNQIQQWEKLVEVSIHFQKCIQTANVLPLPNTFKEFSEKDEFKSTLLETTESCKTLLKNMTALRNASTLNNEELPKELKFNISKNISSDLKKPFENYRSYRNEILQKWQSRTYVASDKANLNINKKIEDLMTNKKNLLTRSQTLNQHYLQKVMSTLKPDQVEQIPEKVTCENIYDDTDFYLSLLQEVIDSKSQQSTNIKEKLKAMNLMKQKMKRVIIKKASKGRKIRYTVHNKLVNFMPINPSITFEDNQRTALFQSLFS